MNLQPRHREKAVSNIILKGDLFTTLEDMSQEWTWSTGVIWSGEIQTSSGVCQSRVQRIRISKQGPELRGKTNRLTAGERDRSWAEITAARPETQLVDIPKGYKYQNYLGNIDWFRMSYDLARGVWQSWDFVGDLIAEWEATSVTARNKDYAGLEILVIILDTLSLNCVNEINSEPKMTHGHQCENLNPYKVRKFNLI